MVKGLKIIQILTDLGDVGGSDDGPELLDDVAVEGLGVDVVAVGGDHLGDHDGDAAAEGVDGVGHHVALEGQEGTGDLA